MHKHFIPVLLCLLLTSGIFTSCSETKQETTANNSTEVEETRDPNKQYVRKNASSPAAKADFEAMAIALKKLKEMDCGNPASWYYQGAIHNVPDTVLNNNPYCPAYTSSKDLKLAWQNCTHTGSTDSDFNFLIWHRFYTMYFEEVVRELSGYEEFALPYWDYCDTINIELNRTLPLPLRTEGNPLYAEARLDSLNAGRMISGEPITTLLNIVNLMKKTDYASFNRTMDRAPHGQMHVYIGAGNSGQIMWNPIYQSIVYEGDSLSGLMTQVESAGFDPVFWLHHSNVDRLWQQWTNLDVPAHLAHPTDVINHPWPYTFFKSNGDTIQYTMEEVAKSMYDVNYRYDDTETRITIPKMAPLLATAQGVTDTIKHVVVNKKINLKNKSFVKSIQLDHVKKSNLKALAITPAKKITLKVDVSFTKEPKNAYQLYINQPEDETPNVEGNNFVGFLTFFGATHHARKSSSTGQINGPIVKTFIYDVTNLCNEAKIHESDQLDISIYLLGNLVEDGITIENYTLYSN